MIEREFSNSRENLNALDFTIYVRLFVTRTDNIKLRQGQTE